MEQEKITLSVLRKKAEEHNVCEQYSKLWDDAMSKKDLMDVCLCSEGCMFMCQSKAEGWGIDTSWLVKNFANYNNHLYVRNQKGYTSAMYAGYKGNILMDTTLLLVIDSDIIMNVPNNYLGKVYVCGKSKITMKGEGRLIFVKYGDNVEINKNEQSKIVEGEYGEL